MSPSPPDNPNTVPCTDDQVTGNAPKSRTPVTIVESMPDAETLYATAMTVQIAGTYLSKARYPLVAHRDSECHGLRFQKSRVDRITKDQVDQLRLVPCKVCCRSRHNDGS